MKKIQKAKLKMKKAKKMSALKNKNEKALALRKLHINKIPINYN